MVRSRKGSVARVVFEKDTQAPWHLDSKTGALHSVYTTSDKKFDKARVCFPQGVSDPVDGTLPVAQGWTVIYPSSFEDDDFEHPETTRVYQLCELLGLYNVMRFLRQEKSLRGALGMTLLELLTPNELPARVQAAFAAQVALIIDQGLYGSDPKGLHLFDYLLSFDRSYESLQKELDAATMMVSADHLGSTLVTQVFQYQNLIKVGLLIGYAILMWHLIPYVLEYLFTYLPNIFRETSHPTNFFQSVLRTFEYLTGLSLRRAGEPSNWDMMAHSPEMQAWIERELRIDERTMTYNMGLTSRERAEGLGLGIAHTLFWGVPGTGKTFLCVERAKFFREQGLAETAWLPGSQVASMTPKEVLEALHTLVQMAYGHYIKTGQPTILTIDEADYLFPSRWAPNTDTARIALVTEFLSVFAETDSTYLVLQMTTNLDLEDPSYRDKIDPAILDRVGRNHRVRFDLPDQATCIRIFNNHLQAQADQRDLQVRAGVSSYLEEVAPALHGCSGRQLAALASEIANTVWADDKQAINTTDLQAALQEAGLLAA